MRYILIILLTLLGYCASAQQQVELCSYFPKSFNYWSSANVSGGGWLWMLNNDTISINNQVTITWSDTGFYRIRVFYQTECGRQTKEYFVRVIDCLDAAIFFPNAFTPNGDGLNDTWVPIPRKIVEVRYNIWNRYGEKVFESNSFDKRWNGKYKGVDQPMSNFVFQAWWTDINGKKGYNKGNLILIR